MYTFKIGLRLEFLKLRTQKMSNKKIGDKVTWLKVSAFEVIEFPEGKFILKLKN